MKRTRIDYGLSEREEMEALLPWYATGKLDPIQNARVERYLAAHPGVAADVPLPRKECDAPITAGESILGTSRQALNRLLSGIAASPRRAPVGHVLRAPFDNLTEWLGRQTPSQLALAAGMAALLMVLQAIAIGALIANRSAVEFNQTAVACQGTEGDIELMVGFSPAATISEITVLLRHLDGVVVEGPRAGLYRIRVPALGNAGREKVLSGLRQSHIVTLVLPGN